MGMHGSVLVLMAVVMVACWSLTDAAKVPQDDGPGCGRSLSSAAAAHAQDSGLEPDGYTCHHEYYVFGCPGCRKYKDDDDVF